MRSPSKRIRVAESELNLPPGFRFHPTDEELIVHYLCHKSQTKLDTCSVAQPPSIIGDIDLYKHEPWELPEMALFGTKEWYFFTPRDRKYPNGSRPNRVTGNGYWKATGADKPIKSKSDPNITVGIKKALVFYAGKGNKGIKMNWIMHEYRLNYIPSKNSSISKLDDWVLCRLYNKKNNPNEMIILQDNNVVNSRDNLHPTLPPLEESQRGRSYSNNNGDNFDSFEYSDEGEFSGNFQGDAIFSAYLPLESLSKDKDTSEQNIMGQTESLMEKKEHENDWFDSLSLEDLHHCLEAMPTSNLDFYEMPIYDF